MRDRILELIIDWLYRKDILAAGKKLKKPINVHTLSRSVGTIDGVDSVMFSRGMS